MALNNLVRLNVSLRDRLPSNLHNDGGNVVLDQMHHRFSICIRFYYWKRFQGFAKTVNP
jgi:hypothetical protein